MKPITKTEKLQLITQARKTLSKVAHKQQCDSLVSVIEYTKAHHRVLDDLSLLLAFEVEAMTPTDEDDEAELKQLERDILINSFDKDEEI